MKTQQSSSKAFLSLYGFVLALYPFSIYFDNFTVQSISTLLMIPLLAVAFYFREKLVGDYFYIISMAWIGDILLLQQNPSTNFAAIISYWGSIFVLCITLQRKVKKIPHTQTKKKEGVFAFLVIGSILLTTIISIFPYYEIIIIPVSIYGITLLLCGVFCFIMFCGNQNNSNTNLILGYILLSVSAIAKSIELFYLKESYSFHWNPIVYGFAQYYFYLYFANESKKYYAL